ncbi:CPBP family intramembrane glutamic endopeptidase [Enemella evansiae]|uniref:CPBP family intramembrane glutamic endopeptidase n=1 Tax=Enemella evansiae TaxID=2016499 RepID=UPI000B9746EF|nr:type II CAAX endopeptidase family protein [Enemella evansiae]OYO13925.1 hypothetical protein CGZ98_04895 [Enemella evansiae]OYO18511.1 hypothetical protein BI335_07465 [Enemella evansiae]TDO84809.1 CAAX prenyl protease-like protein [Enemella evansiae]
MAGPAGRRPHTLDLIGAVCVALLGAGVLWVSLRHPAGLPGSSDPGAGRTPAWLTALVVLVVVALTRLAPPRLPPVRVRFTGPPVRIVAVVWGLLGFEAMFVASSWFPPLFGDADYVFWKVVWYAGAGGLLVLWARHRGQRRHLERPAAGWWPLLPVLVFCASLVGGPAAQRFTNPTGIDPVTVAIIAAITALTAGVLEEFFFRGWLQTRLQALGSGWAAVAISSVAFAGMHLGSHGGGLPALDSVASVLANQGLSGVLLGHLALRYGRLWPSIVAHIGLNGLPVLAYLVALP